MKDIAKGLVYGGLFVIPFIVLIIANSMFFPFITGKNFAFRIITEIVFASWVVLQLYDASYRPKFSWTAIGFCAFLIVMFFADLFGLDPMESFWSNFERMEGYVTLVHLSMYFIVLGSVFKTKEVWNRYFNTTLVAAILLSVYAFAQMKGNLVINQGGWRLDGTLGNAAYMAIYLLFHAFIALLMAVRVGRSKMGYIYLLLAGVFSFLLVMTATRGTMLGLFAGLLVAAFSYVIFSKNRNARLVGSALVVGFVLMGTLFFSFKESSWIQENPYLSRFANISLSEGSIRFSIWHMAFDAAKEHPLLGYGQGNFNYVFNEKYDPSLYAAESWYDRVHNIFFDWLIAGGLLGVFTYFFIFFSAIVALLRSSSSAHTNSFSVLERCVLLGLLAGYLVHNFFVFDNIVSYIFYAVVLALIHSQTARTITRLQSLSVTPRVVDQVVAPTALVILIAVVYVVNVPNIQAAQDIIDGLRATDSRESLQDFSRALSRHSFADQEIREQLTRQTENILASSQATPQIKQEAVDLTQKELETLRSQKPRDARVLVFLSSFYRMKGEEEKALQTLKDAEALSPKKQQIIMEEGAVLLQLERYEEALQTFKRAYELDTRYDLAAVYYAIGAIYAGDPSLAKDILNTDERKKQFAQNNAALKALQAKREYPLLSEMLRLRITIEPQNKDLYTSLAFVLRETGDTEGAISVLTEAGKKIPSFKKESDAYIKELRSD